MNCTESAAKPEAIEQDHARIPAVRAAAVRRRRFPGSLRAAAILAGALLCEVPQAAAQGGGPGGGPGGVNALEARVAALEARMAAAESVNAAQSAQIAALEAKTQHVSVAGGEMFITGTNLHVVNGLGETGQVNGKGNLIVGYNQLKNDGSDDRTGSHNIVAGDWNDYSSFGGLVTGFNNDISGIYASITGGNGNSASGSSSHVSGGRFNTASFHWACVGGGESNTASQIGSSVSGGYNITQAGGYGWSAGSSYGNDVLGNFRSP